MVEKATGIDRFLAEVRKFQETPAFRGGTLAFRGHPDHMWKLRSSATRRLVRKYGCNILKDDFRFSKMYVNYHFNELTQPARMNGYGLEDGNRISDLELLAKLQHLGAATGLIDFTWNPIVALWFACGVGREDECGREDEHDWDKCDGKVFVVNLNDTTKFQITPNGIEKQTVQAIFPRGPRDSPYYWEPPPRGPSAPRILRQRSVFIIGRPLIPEHVVDEIVIPAADKKEIRRELEERLDTNELSLFIDVHGFSVANCPESPIRRMDDPIVRFEHGNHSYQRSGYSQAIGEYDRCVNSEPDAWEPYMARGNAKADIAREDAKAEIKLFSDAQKDYDSALHCRESLYYGDEASINLIQITNEWKIFYNRGNMKAALRDYRGAIEDYDKAVEYPSVDRDLFGPIFFNRANAKACLCRFEEARMDYDDAVLYGSYEGHFNKANALVFLGDFSEALKCYRHKSLREGQYGRGAAHNEYAVQEILAILGESKPQVDTNRSNGQFHVVVRFASADRCQRSFSFQGNIGNARNFGLHHVDVPPGKGFSDDPDFSVELIGAETD